MLGREDDDLIEFFEESIRQMLNTSDTLQSISEKLKAYDGFTRTGPDL
jgi:ribosomal protein L13